MQVPFSYINVSALTYDRPIVLVSMVQATPIYIDVAMKYPAQQWDCDGFLSGILPISGVGACSIPDRTGVVSSWILDSPWTPLGRRVLLLRSLEIECMCCACFDAGHQKDSHKRVFRRRSQKTSNLFMASVEAPTNIIHEIKHERNNKTPWPRRVFKTSTAGFKKIWLELVAVR